MLLFRREGLVCSQSDLDAKPKNVTCYGIATVFTPLRFRGNGYGKHMMRLLHWVLADTSLLPLSFPSEWGTPPPRVPLAGDGWFSALWSDVGEDFYMRCGPTKDQDGWIVRAPFSTTWTVGKESSGLDTHDDEWTLLDEAGVLKLWENDADNIARSVSLADNYQAAFTFLASQGVAAFQYRRNMDVLAKYFPPPIQHWGIIADPDTFATWTFEVRSPPKTLLITRLSCSPLDFDTLLGRIMTIAGKHGLQQVEVYNLPGDLQSAALRLGGSTKEREEHLSAFKWYGPEDQSQVAWLLNER
ncbi:hypothetical protein C0991_005430 [Blastosporella zonata]|nr:hypothetical protein C0991_005430 [Blastosporella zonata]